MPLQNVGSLKHRI